ncbi:MAG: PAS domain S-box protein [Sedimentisphaerales bacterium]|nr:PAS domain S-box protein [Sedimentisphaerales bacterium]
MNEARKTKKQLIGEMQDLRLRLAQMENPESRPQKTDKDLYIKDRAMASSVIAISMTDMDSRITYANKAYLTLWGYDREEEIFGQDVKMFAHNPYDVERILQTVLNTGSWNGDVVGKRKDGSCFDAEMFCNIVLDKEGKPLCFMGSFVDISKRKQTEEQLRASQMKYKTLYDSSRDAIMTLTPQEGFISGNPATVKMFECKDESEFVSQSPADLSPQYQPDGQLSIVKAQEMMKIALDNGSHYFEWKHIQMNGREFDATVLLTRMELEGKKMLQATVRDITERKRAEQALKKAKDELELRVKERTEELSQANARLQEQIAVRIQAEQKLLDYQNKLRSLASQLSLTEQRERRQIAAELHDRIAQNLAFSLIKLGDLTEKTAGTETADVLKDINELIEKIIQDTRSLIYDLGNPVLEQKTFEEAVEEWLCEQIEKQYCIECQFEDDGRPKRLSDDLRLVLFQSVRELVINIIKHAQAKKVKVTTQRDDDNTIIIMVKDDGIGFEPDKISFTIGRTGGFGLFSIHERLGYLNGKMKIQSKPGKGTCVTLIAPLADHV